MDKFLHLKSTDLAQETSFINWVNASNVSDINQWNKWIADHPEKRAIIDEAKLIVTSINFEEDNPSTDLENKIWKNINAATGSDSLNTTPETPTGLLKILKKWAPLAAAAIIALLVYVNVSTSTNYDTNLKTDYAENRQELLPDGSIIDVNAESEVAYSKANWESDRQIKLDGEAYFSVKKGSKFTVLTDNGNVEVLGTSFNVYSRENIFSVECETGKVSVSANGKEVILMPNEGVRLNLDQNELAKTEATTKRSAWRRGSYNYKDIELREVFDDIERRFDVKIDLNKIPNDQTYNGQFSSTNIDSVLHQVCWPLDLVVKRSGKDYQISSSKK